MIDILSAAQSREQDRQAESDGVSADWLMEVAGAKAAQYLESRVGLGPLVVVAGGGRNGGDGLVVARYLARRRPTTVVLLRGLPNFESASHLVACARQYGVQCVEAEALQSALAGAAAVIDAIIGTGVRAPLRPWARDAIAAVNASGLPVYALDVPSGVDADTGQIVDNAVRARATITFSASKWGHWCYPGASQRGELAVADIGLPGVAGVAEVINADRIRRWLKPLAVDGHKYHRGRLAVVGGSAGMPGAPQMTAQAALRMGAGLVQLVVPSSLLARLEPSPAMLVYGGGEDERGTLCLSSADLETLKAADAIVLGPGLGMPSSTDWIQQLLELGKPMVVDADGLTILPHLDWTKANRGSVLTPHEGEMARMLGTTAQSVRSDRYRAFESATDRYQTSVILKGPYSLCGRRGHIGVNTNGVAELATAGSGDVLSGIVGALLAQGYSDWQAAQIGARVHGAAGRSARQSHGESLIALDLIEALKMNWKTLATTGDEELVECL